MVSFFDQPASVTRFKVVHAVWRRQRMEVLPGVAPVALLLARTDNTVVGLTDVRGYPAGFGFTLNLRLRSIDPRERRGFWPFPEFAYHRGRALPADAILRLTIEFADGRSVTNFNPPTVGSDAPDPDRPMLSCGPGPAGKLMAGPLTWTIGFGPCPRGGRWPSFAPGPGEGSHRRGSRSTAQRFGRRPLLR